MEKKLKAAIADPNVDFITELLTVLPNLILDVQMLERSWKTDTVIDKYVNHFWYEDETNVQYHGKILRVKRRKMKRLTLEIAYWSNDEVEDNAEDYKMSLSQVLTDYLLDDLIFLDY